MSKPKRLSDIRIFNSSSLKNFLHKNPDKLREFVNNNIDFDDMDLEIDSDSICCPFCQDTGFHGQVNNNYDTNSHNIYCFKCSDLKNNGHAYTPWYLWVKGYEGETVVRWIN